MTSTIHALPLRIAAPLLGVVLLTLLSIPAPVHAQGGDLTPTQGNGALDGGNNAQRSMIALDEIDPRTPIRKLPFTVSSPGSYYLTGNLLSLSDGINVNASDVSIDLRGFTMTGTGTAEGFVGVHAIGRSGVVVRGGTIRGFGVGIYFQDSNHCVVEDVAATGCNFDGIRIRAIGAAADAKGNVISRCRISNSGDDGIELHVNAEGSSVNGTSIRDCVISDAGSIGIRFDSFMGEINGTRITGCTIQGAGSNGIGTSSTTGDLINTVIDSCTVSETNQEGIEFQVSGSGILRNLCISRCHVSFTEARGINVQGALGNLAEAIVVKECVVTDVTGPATSGDGIRLSRTQRSIIRDNYVTRVFRDGGASLGGGYKTTVCSDNLIIGNTSFGNSPNFIIDANDIIGPIVTTTGTLGSTGAAVHPWANFGF